jgi:hypothetical protein
MFFFNTSKKYQAQLLFIKDSTFEVLPENKTHTVDGNDVAYRNINCIHFARFDVTTKAYIHNVYVVGFSGYMFVCESYLQEIDFFNFKGGWVGGFISFNREYDAENPNASPFGNFGKGSSNILTFNQCGIDLGIDANNDIQDIVSLSRMIMATFQSCVFQGNGRGANKNLYYLSFWENQQTPHITAIDCWNEFVGTGTNIGCIVFDSRSILCEVRGGRFAASYVFNYPNNTLITDSLPSISGVVINNDSMPTIWIKGKYNTYTTIGQFIDVFKDKATLKIELSCENVNSDRSRSIIYNPYKHNSQINAIAKEHSESCEFVSVNGIKVLRQQPHTTQDISDTSKIYLLSKTTDVLFKPQSDWTSPIYHLVYRVYPIVPVTQSNIELFNGSNDYGDGIYPSNLIFNGAKGSLFTLEDTSTDPNDYPWKEVITNVTSYYNTVRNTHGLWGIDIAVCEILADNCSINRSINPNKTDPKILDVPDKFDNSISSIENFTPSSGELIGICVFDVNLGKMVTWNGTEWVDANSRKPYKDNGIYADRPTFTSGTNKGATYFATDLNLGNGLLIVWNGNEWRKTNGDALDTYYTVTDSTNSGISIDNTTSVLLGDSFEANVVSSLGLEIGEITVTMGGVNQPNAFDAATQKISIASVIGDIEVSGGNEILRILKFTAKEANSSVKLKFNGENAPTVNVETSIDGSTWSTYTIGDVITLDAIDDYVMFRGNNLDGSGKCKFTTWASGIDESHHNFQFEMSGNIEASGDITSLCNQKGGDVALTQYVFMGLFNGCTSLTKAPNLPSTTLNSQCYGSMFMGCTGLTVAPLLPALIVPASGYNTMFYNCSNLAEIRTYMTDISANYALNAWVYGVAASGNFYCDSSLVITANDTSGIPSGWPRYNLDDTIWRDPNAE